MSFGTTYCSDGGEPCPPGIGDAPQMRSGAARIAFFVGQSIRQVASCELNELRVTMRREFTPWETELAEAIAAVKEQDDELAQSRRASMWQVS